MNIVIKQKDRNSEPEFHAAYDKWSDAFEAASELSKSGAAINATIFSFSNKVEFGGENRIQANWVNSFTRSDIAGPVTTDNYFGGCPQCGKGEYVNVFKSHFNVCGTHKVFWSIGYNLFSTWQEENEEIWRKNDEMLSGFTEVYPIYPPDSRPVTGAELKAARASNECPF
jgi:hypothetical protein